MRHTDWKEVDDSYETDHQTGQCAHRFCEDIQLSSREIVCPKTTPDSLEMSRTERSDKRKKTFNLTNEANNDNNSNSKSQLWRNEQSKRSQANLVPSMSPTPSEPMLTSQHQAANYATAYANQMNISRNMQANNYSLNVTANEGSHVDIRLLSPTTSTVEAVITNETPFTVSNGLEADGDRLNCQSDSDNGTLNTEIRNKGNVSTLQPETADNNSNAFLLLPNTLSSSPGNSRASRPKSSRPKLNKTIDTGDPLPVIDNNNGTGRDEMAKYFKPKVVPPTEAEIDEAFKQRDTVLLRQWVLDGYGNQLYAWRNSKSCRNSSRRARRLIKNIRNYQVS